MGAENSIARDTGRSALGHRPGFWIIAFAFLVAMAFSTLPTPLYTIYQRLDGFPGYVITLVFATYAVGVMLSLYLAGHISDWLGRRRVILSSVLIEAISAAIFLFWPELPGLFLARLVSGIGIGALTATATAHLSELRAVSHPHEKGRRSVLVSTVVNMGGLSLGPLFAGIFAETSSKPLVVPYAVFLVLLLIAAAAVALVPETVEKAEERPAYRPQRLATAGNGKAAFFAAAAGGFAAFAIMGLFTSLAPSFVAGKLHESSRFVAGLVSFSVFGAGTLAQIAFSTFAARRQLGFGISGMALGLALVASGALVSSLALFITGGILAGAGAGLMFRASIASAAALAAPHNRASILASIFLISYAGLVLPVIGLGLALLVLASDIALVIFSAIILALVAWSGIVTLGGNSKAKS